MTDNCTKTKKVKCGFGFDLGSTYSKFFGNFHSRIPWIRNFITLILNTDLAFFLIFFFAQAKIRQTWAMHSPFSSRFITPNLSPIPTTFHFFSSSSSSLESLQGMQVFVSHSFWYRWIKTNKLKPEDHSELNDHRTLTGSSQWTHCFPTLFYPVRFVLSRQRCATSQRVLNRKRGERKLKSNVKSQGEL